MTAAVSGSYGGYNYQSPEARALSSITTDSYDYRDQGKLITKLTGDVSYLANYMRKMQKGIDDANQNVVQQIQSLINDILAILGGGGDTGFDFGDLKYALQAFGAMFGISTEDGIGGPVNLTQAAWHFFSEYLLGLANFKEAIDQLVDGVIGSVLDHLGEIPIIGQAAQQLAVWITNFRGALEEGGIFLQGLFSDWTQSLVDAIKTIVQKLKAVVNHFTGNSNDDLTQLDSWGKRLPIMNTVGGTISTSNVPDLNAAKITAGTFVRSLIGIQDFENIAAGSDWEGTHPWTLASNHVVDNVGALQAKFGTKVLRLDGNSTTGTSTLQGTYNASAGDEFYMTMWVKKISSWNGNSSNQFKVVSMPSNTSLGTINFGTSDILLAGVWGLKTLKFAVPAASTDTELVFTLNTNSTATAGSVYIDNIVIRRTKDVNLIADNAIIESKIADSAVTGAKTSGLDGSKITGGTVAEARIASLSAGKITTGTFLDTLIPSLNASKINAGTFTTGLIPSLDGSKILTGTLAEDRIASLSQSKVTNLVTDLGAKLKAAIFNTRSRALHNLVPSPSFEDNTVLRCSYIGNTWSTNNYSQVQERSGSYSWSWTAPTPTAAYEGLRVTPNETDTYFDVTPGDKYYVEAYVYVPTASGTTGSVVFGVHYYNNLTYLGGSSVSLSLSTLTKDSWNNKLSGYFTIPSANPPTVPSGANRAYFWILSDPSVTPGAVFYVDDVIVREATESTGIKIGLFGTNTVGTTILTGAVPSIDGSKINTGTLAEDRIASLSAGKITTGTFLDTLIPNLNASKINAGTFTTGLIPSLDGSKILTGTLAEDRIASLSAGKITTGTFLDTLIPNLNASKINAGTFLDTLIPSLSAGKITSGTFTTGLIPSLDGSKILTGTLAEDRISSLSAGKITSGTFLDTLIPILGRRKLRNTDFSNLMEDPGFENGTTAITTVVANGAYTIQTPTTGTPAVPDVPVGGTRVLQMASTGAIVDVSLEPYGINVVPGEHYYLECSIRKTTTGTTGTVGIATSMGKDGTSWVSYPGITTSMASLTTQNTWYKLSGIVQVPAGANFMAIRTTIRNDVPSGQTLQFDNIVCRKATSTELLADDAVTTAKIGPLAVTSAELAAAAVTAGKIGAGAVATADIANDAVTTAKIGPLAVTNAEIATDAVDTANIKASAVTGAKTAALDAAKITTGQMAQAQVVSLSTDLGNRVDYSAYQAYVSSGGNLCTNPSFEDTTQYTWNGVAETTITHSGSRSMKLTGNGVNNYYIPLITNKTADIYVVSGPNRKFYVEYWVCGDENNVTYTGTTNVCGIGIWVYDTAGANPGGGSVLYATAATVGRNTRDSGTGILTENWVKVTGIITVGAQTAIAKARPLIIVPSTCPANNTFYFDDVIVREITESVDINKSLYNQNTPLAAILASVVPSIDGSKINTGTLAEDRIASLSAGKITSGTFLDTLIPNLNASKINAGTFLDTLIPNLAAGKITSGTFTTGLIPSLDGSKILTGTLAEDRIASLSAGKITSGTFLDTLIPTLAQSKITNLGTDITTTKNLARGKLLSGANLVSNPGFEYTTFAESASLDATTKRTGSRSLKLTADAVNYKTQHLFYDESTSLTIPAVAGDVFYMEAYVLRAGVAPTVGNIWIQTQAYDKAGATISYPSTPATAASAISTDSTNWTKISGYVEMPANTTKVAAYVVVGNTVTSGSIFYFDDIVFKEYSHTANLNKTLFNQNTPLSAILATVIPNLDGSKINTGTIDETRLGAISAGKITSGTFADTLIPSLAAGKITSGTFLDTLIPSLAASKITSGTFLDARIPSLDGSKINTGTIDETRLGAISQGKITGLTTALGTAQGTADTINNNIAKELSGDVNAASGVQAAIDSLKRTFSGLSGLTKAVQELQSTKGASSTKGGSWVVDFSEFASVTAAGFSLTYSPVTGNNSIVVTNGVAQWNVVDSVNRDAKLIYQTDTLTDFQSVRGTMSAPPQAPSGTTPYFYAIARVSPDGLYYVWARAYAVAFGNYKADIGYCLNGVETTWASNISLTWSLDMRFVAGVGTNEREYQIWSGNTIVYSFTESTIVSRLCSNSAHTDPTNHDTSCTKYRKWGAIAQIRNQKTAGKVESCSATDNGTPSVNGSVARMVRTSTASVTYTGGSTITALPASFFDSIPHESLDIDAVTSTGSFKVTDGKPYIISARIALSNSVSATGTLILQRSTDGGTTWTSVQYGPSFYTNTGWAIFANWVQYLDANDRVRLAYVRDGVTTTSLTGDANGAQTYFAIAGVEGAG